jgi:hypothetical protein
VFGRLVEFLNWPDSAGVVYRLGYTKPEPVMLVSLQAPVFAPAPAEDADSTTEHVYTPTSSPVQPEPPVPHPAWREDASWKHRLTNLRLLLQPFLCTCLLLPWLRLYPLLHLTAGLAELCALMNTYHPLFPT